MRSGSKTTLILAIPSLLSIGKFADLCGSVSSLIQPSFIGNRSLINDAVSDSPTPTTTSTTGAFTTASDVGTGGGLASVGTITDNVLISSPQMPIPFTLKTFDAADIGKYSTCADLRNDLQNAAAFLASLTILQNLEYGGNTYYGYDSAAPSMSGNETEMTHVTRAMSASQQKCGIKTASSGRTNPYDTNNRVDGIDEADLVKTDGVNVFTGYGNVVVVWNAISGVELSRTYMVDPATPAAVRPGAGDAPTDYFPEPTLQVRSLFLNGNRLVVIVVDYSSHLSGDFNQSIIPSNGNTKVRFFDITNIPRDDSELRFLTEEVLPGNYLQTAYLIGNYLHCVGGSYWDTDTHLVRFFDRRSQEYASLNSTEYIAAAVAASKKVIRNFVTKLTSELVVGNSCEDIPQLAIFLEGGDNDGRSVSMSAAINAGGMSSLVYITTLNTQFDRIKQNKVQLATAVTTTSNSWFFTTYANDGYLFLVTQGSSTNENDRYEDASYIVACTLSTTGGSATIQSVGIVPGSIYDERWLDYYQGHLRIATTISSDWGCANGEYISYDLYRNFTDCDYQLLSKSKNIITVLKAPLDRNNRLQQVGLLQILSSNDDAVISSVRFVQNKAFMILPGTIDSSSLYTIDMRDPTALDISGTVDVSGSFSQLLLFDTEDNFLIAFGKDSYSGRFQLGLVDTTDSRNPVFVQQYDVGLGRANMSNVFMASDADYDYRAVHWLPDVNKLVLPLRWVNHFDFNETENTFEGFMVFDVTTEQIELNFEISQVAEQYPHVICWYSVVRSLLIDGVLTTIKGRTVVTTSLDSKEEMFVLDLAKDTNKTVCLYYTEYLGSFT